MAITATRLDLTTTENQILLNPRLPKEDYLSLYDLATWAQDEKTLTDHVWVATSGSTASSVFATKLVALSRTALKASAQAVNLHLQSGPSDKWTQILPSFHVGGMGIEARAVLSGATVVRAFRDEKWDVDYFYQVLTQEQCTLSALVPTQVYDLVAKGYKAPAHLRAVVIGGGAFEKDLYLKAKELGWPVLPSYGMTETASQIATASMSSIGLMEYPDMTLLSHARARTNADGFLQVRAKSLLSFYAQNTESGAKVWSPIQDGWFTTEDRGRVVEGALEIEGRSKDYLKIGGEATNLSALRAKLDRAALALNKSWPLKVALLDMPSDRLGAEIQLCSLLSEEDTEKVVGAFAQDVLPFEKIRKVYYVDHIPRSDLGKILWAELRSKL